jgi:RNA polymerase sigma factor (sigma-70 family)
MDMSIAYYLETPGVAGGLLHGGEGVNGDDGDGGERGIALRDCLTSNYHRLHRRLVRYLGCADRASDCLHDAWLRLGETTVSDVMKNPEAYVYRVACNAAIDSLRCNRLLHDAGDAERDMAWIADAAPGPDAVAEARSSLAAMDLAMTRLPRLHKAVLVALRVDELPRQEVAHRYGLSLRTVDTTLRRALECCAQAA